MLETFQTQAVRRRLLPASSTLTPATAFALVRDMPYKRAKSRAPEAIVTEWQGTCSGKHYLLKELFQEMGVRTRVIMCTHQFDQTNTAHFPESLRKLTAQGPVPDVHTFLRLETDNSWMDVDATWPAPAEALGMPVNRDFQTGVSMGLACSPIEYFVVPDGVEPQPFKEDLIRRFCGGDVDRREAFIQGMSGWLAENTGN
jgi:hypothetical protein